MYMSHAAEATGGVLYSCPIAMVLVILDWYRV